MPEENKDIKLNGQVLTESEFKDKKTELENKPGVKVVKVKENNYKTEIQG